MIEIIPLDKCNPELLRIVKERREKWIYDSSHPTFEEQEELNRMKKLYEVGRCDNCKHSTWKLKFYVKTPGEDKIVFSLNFSKEDVPKCFFDKHFLGYDISGIGWKQIHDKIYTEIAKEHGFGFFKEDTAPEEIKSKYGATLVESNVPNNNEFSFDWNEIPGKDSVRFVDFLVRNYIKDWKNPKVEKSLDNKVIRVSNDTESIVFELDKLKHEKVLSCTIHTCPVLSCKDFEEIC